jgi:dipeptidyl aminopeptidase/acylaminoacyl peptidase
MLGPVARGAWMGGVAIAWLAAAQQTTAQSLPGDVWVKEGLATADQRIQTPMVGGAAANSIAISHNGRYIAYTGLQADIANNVNVEGVWLLDKDSPSGPRLVGDPIQGPDIRRFDPRFSPNDDRLAYVVAGKLVIQTIANSARVEINAAEIPADSLGTRYSPTSIKAFAWDPDGTQLAVLVEGKDGGDVRSGVEVTTDERDASESATPTRLAVYKMKTGQWNLVSLEAVQVDSFDWSPSGTQLVYAGSTTDGPLWSLHNNLYISDLNHGTTTKVQLPRGFNQHPLWSPDGRWIAFQSQGGQLRYLDLQRVGLYEVERGALTYPAHEEIGRISGSHTKILGWSPDSKTLLLTIPYHLSDQLFTLSVPHGTLTRFMQDDKQDSYAAQYEPDGHAVVYIAQSFSRPPTLYETPVKEFRPRSLTQSQDQSNIEVRELSWPSEDGRWTVHGWLLLPKPAPAHVPLLVYAAGGPLMVRPEFRLYEYHYSLQAFVANGVAVLIPNSRGREGYGTDFQMAWETERDCGAGPLSDDLKGVDALVAAGLVDPNRIAFAGHSWGGYLAAYALTHTNRFKAILVHEAVNLNIMERVFAISASREWTDFAQQLGMDQPFGDNNADRLRGLSPVYQVEHASTPALLEFGANSLLNEGIALFQGLQHFKVPSELIGYPRTGHITEEPALLHDAARRDLEWFAYWVLGKPTERMLDRYGPPKISEWNPNTGDQVKTLN